MASRTRKADVVEIVVEPGRCGDGCGAEVAKGRSFRQGHDAKLKSILGRAHKAGQQVRIVNDGTATTRAAQAELEARGWPVPKVPEPRAAEGGSPSAAQDPQGGDGQGVALAARPANTRPSAPVGGLAAHRCA